MFAHEFSGTRYDVGDKFGFMTTSIEYGLKHPEIKDNLREYIISLGKELSGQNKTKNNFQSADLSLRFLYY